jgi:hypothetical protein
MCSHRSCPGLIKNSVSSTLALLEFSSGLALLLSDFSCQNPLLLTRVIHVSQLKLAVRFPGTTSSTLPSNSLQYIIPMQMLSNHIVVRGGSHVPQLLIKWSALPDSLAT